MPSKPTTTGIAGSLPGASSSPGSRTFGRAIGNSDRVDARRVLARGCLLALRRASRRSSGLSVLHTSGGGGKPRGVTISARVERRDHRVGDDLGRSNCSMTLSTRSAVTRASTCIRSVPRSLASTPTVCNTFTICCCAPSLELMALTRRRASCCPTTTTRMRGPLRRSWPSWTTTSGCRCRCRR